LQSILVVAPDAEPKPEPAEKTGYEMEVAPVAVSGPASGNAFVNPYLQLLASIPELKEKGQLIHSCPPVALTEPEAEYVVTCIRHVYSKHAVLQFNIENNIEDQALMNVQVDVVVPEASDWQLDLIIPDPLIKHGKAGVAFVVLERGSAFSTGPMPCMLKFVTRDAADEDDSGVDDEYQLEEIEIRESSFMRAGPPIGNFEFRRQWESIGPSSEVVQQYALQLDSLQAGVTAVLNLLGMQACAGTETVPEGATTHTLNMTGIFDVDTVVLSRTAFIIGPGGQGVKLKIAVRSSDSKVNILFANAIR